MNQSYTRLLMILTAIVLITAAMLAAFALSYQLSYGIMSVAPQENAKRVQRTVKAVCDFSSDRMNGELEEACGIAQDVSGTTYKCPNSQTRECWVEEN